MGSGTEQDYLGDRKSDIGGQLLNIFRNYIESKVCRSHEELRDL